MKLKAGFDVYEEKNYTPEYRALLSKQTVAHRHINESSGEERQKWINEYKRIHKLVLKTPAKSQTDKKIKYIRYADYTEVETMPKNSFKYKKIPHFPLITSA